MLDNLPPVPPSPPKINEEIISVGSLTPPPGKTKKIRTALMVLGLFFLLASIPAAVYVVQQRQEVRKEAACGGLEGTHCNTENCHQYTCIGESWRDDGKCGGACKSHPDCQSECSDGGDGGDGGGACGAVDQPCCDDDSTPGSAPYAHGCNSSLHCLSGGSQAGSNERGTCKTQSSGGDGCETCEGSCNKDGCSVDGEGINCKTDCNMWPRCFYCHGRSHSGCGDGSDYHQTSGNISYDKEYWCSTIQCDVANDYVVVYIGDRGEYCVEGKSCNPDDLDWDCAEVTPTPTLTPTPTPRASCEWIKAYSIEGWQELNSVALSALQPGNHVYFAVFGDLIGGGSFDKARFRINAGAWQETTATKAGTTDQFYIEYVIPAGVTNFSVQAEVHHPTQGWK